ncbi:MAG TPA: dUTP diphosphatase [Bdellovibrionales bacterium]|nr:dUTP diphosphatase [Bdellovibrionales bacterium]
MELSQLKKSVQEIAKVVGAMVEEKLGDRSQIEEQVRQFAKQVETMVGDTIAKRVATSGLKGDKVILRFKKLDHFRGELPAYATGGASGLDVRARLDQDVVLKPGDRFLVPTGLSLEIPHGYEVQARPRSGLAITKGISLVNTPGTIDADYRGEVKIIVINHGKESVTLCDQERIAQLVVCPVIHAEIEVAQELSDTQRGAGGFGSTGAN